MVNLDPGEQLQRRFKHGSPEPATDYPTRHTRTLFAQARGGHNQPREFAQLREEEFDE